ncbi:MAG: hypothetical protein KAI66_06010 [Lentisphaeria bacterium]|nr:hypothetical protein [Lentisphaeria bacterium]
MTKAFRHPLLLLTALFAATCARPQEGPVKEIPTGELPSVTKSFATQIHERSTSKYWRGNRGRTPLNRDILAASVEAARAYYLSHQKADGNFIYEHDIVLDKIANDDNQVRQAGALWGLACLNRDRPNAPTARSVLRGLDFFYANSRALPIGKFAPVYPGETRIKTGMVALVCLAMTELWRGEQRYFTRVGKGFVDSWFTNYLDYLAAMELDNGSWGRDFNLDTRERNPVSSPYYDGECLLAYCRAARYMNREELIPKIEKIAPLLAKRYTTDEWRKDPGSDLTKSFFQWGCMAFADYVEAGWKDADQIGDAALALAWWQIHENRLLLRRGNVGYAVEGLVAVHKIARLRGDRRAMRELKRVIDQVLSELVTWQVNGPLEAENFFLRTLGHRPKLAFGGIMSRRDSGIVRIDTVQHQVHATLMAMEELYPDPDAARKKRTTPSNP